MIALRRRLRAVMPKGGWLPDEEFERRHRAMLLVLAAHLPVLLVFGLAIDGNPASVIGQVLAVGAGIPLTRSRRRSRVVRAVVASVSLMGTSAILVSYAGGAGEAHFHFFIMLALLSLYQDWAPFLTALAFVLVHHGVFGTINPQRVYANPQAQEQPWLFGVIHGVAVLVASAIYVAAWRLNEEAQEEVRRVTARFKSLVSSSSDLVLIVDDGTIAYASPASTSVLGIVDTELQGWHAEVVAHPDDRELLAAVLADPGQATEHQRCRLIHADGSIRTVEYVVSDMRETPAVGGVVLTMRDVTEGDRLERELRHAQKLESVGQLASGIAHEINTPIQFVGDNVRFLRSAFEDYGRMLDAYRAAALDPTPGAIEAAAALDAEVDAEFIAGEVPAAIEQTLDGVDRVATIVRAMKAFGVASNDVKAPADLNDAVRNTLVVAKSELKYVTDVELDLEDLPLVTCHLGDINQVLLNLFVNAAHAMAETGERGLLTVRTRDDGTHVRVEVADTGPGIPREIADRVFEPFFTTKEVGVGTGQGLSLAYSLICERHGGTITFDSEPGQGTTFVVRLPVDDDARASNPTASRSAVGIAAT